MEMITSSAEDVLVDGFSFKLGNSASYITDRKSVTFWPSGSNVYSPVGGTKVIKFQLNPDGWCDPSTVPVMFDLNNKATGANATEIEARLLRILQGPGSFSVV